MYEHIPQELKKQPRWVCWLKQPDETRPGRFRKVPINPYTGGQAQSNNPATWSDYSTAVKSSNRFSGIGYMLGGGYFGVDIDGAQDAIDDYKSGDENNIVAEFIHTLQSYSEYSVSGNGIHIICKGMLPPSGRRKQNVEMYSEGRFFIMTGHIAAEYGAIRDCTEAIRPLHEKYIGGGAEPTAVSIPITPLALDEEELLRLAQNSKQGRMFSDLYDGNYESYFHSHSEADLSLCNMLAFWCRRDEGMMDRLFRRSGLMRPKWERKQNGATYGKMTLTKAVQSCTAVYEPPGEYRVEFGAACCGERKTYSLDDTGNAERMVDMAGDRIRYSYVDRCWLYYDGRRWCTDVTGAIKRFADQVVERMAGDMDIYANQTEEMEKQFLKHLKTSRSNKAKTAMIKETEHRVPIVPDELDRHNHLFNVPNGTINLKTGELSAHDSERYISKIGFTEYTDKMDAPLWTAFLSQIFGGDEPLIRYVQKAVGYSLTGSTQEQCAFFCYGTGRNGKSTFLDTLSDVLGDYAVNIQPETLMVKGQSGGPNSDIARLKGARFVTSVEPNEGVRLNEGLLKQLTGGDRVTARKLYGNEFEFTPEFKLWMGTNHKPVIRGTDVGIWRRVHLIPFSVQIPEDKIDKRLKYKLRREFPAILKWAVDGCLLWQREGLERPAAVLNAVKEYQSEMDVVAAFTSECIVTGKGDEQASDVYRCYSKWAEENNEYRMSNTKFGREMAKRFEKVRKKDGIYYCGIQIADMYKVYNVKFNF